MEMLLTHLWKSTVLIAIFYGFYAVLLRKETYFGSIRYFLLLGIIISFTLPFVTLTKYITVEPLQAFMVENATTYNTQENPLSNDWHSIVISIYAATTLFLALKFLFHLVSVGILIQKSARVKVDTFYIIETNTPTSPFSFFNFIIYNPAHFDSEERKQIIAHEKVHAVQKHSLDTILANLLVVLLWFNPFAWFYKNVLEQNLEFIADDKAQKTNKSNGSYEQLLLKTSIPNYQMALANNFYNSLLKKRIIMLHKRRSNKKSQWKFAMIVPLLLGFMLIFNVQTIAQQKQTKTKIVTTTVDIFALRIGQKATKSDLNTIIDSFSEKGLTVKFSGIKRNKAQEITAIKINAKTTDGKTTTSYSVNDDKPIQPIQISYDKENNKVSIGSVDSGHLHEYTFSNKDKHNSFVVISGDHENTWVSKSGNEKMVIEIDEDHEDHENHDNHDIEETIIVDENGKEIKKEIIKIKKGGNNKFVFISDSEDKNPLIILDGKEITKKEMNALDTETIQSIDVSKGEKAIAKYGKKAVDGVIVIITKNKK